MRDCENDWLTTGVGKHYVFLNLEALWWYWMRCLWRQSEDNSAFRLPPLHLRKQAPTQCSRRVLPGVCLFPSAGDLICSVPIICKWWESATNSHLLGKVSDLESKASRPHPRCGILYKIMSVTWNYFLFCELRLLNFLILQVYEHFLWWEELRQQIQKCWHRGCVSFSMEIAVVTFFWGPQIKTPYMTLLCDLWNTLQIKEIVTTKNSKLSLKVETTSIY